MLIDKNLSLGTTGSDEFDLSGMQPSTPRAIYAAGYVSLAMKTLKKL